MRKFGMLWAVVTGAFFGVVVYKGGKDDGLEVGLNAGVAIGQELANQDIEVKTETKESDE